MRQERGEQPQDSNGGTAKQMRQEMVRETVRRDGETVTERQHNNLKDLRDRETARRKT